MSLGWERYARGACGALWSRWVAHCQSSLVNLAIHYCDGYIDHRFQKPLPSAPLAVYSLLTHAILPISFGDGHSTVRYEHQAGTVSVVSFVIDSLMGLVAHSYGC